MSVRRQIIAALSSGRRGGFVSLYDVDHATRLVDAHAAEARAEDRATPLTVARFDTAIEPAPEEEPVLTIGCIADDGRPVALMLNVEDRRKVARWLAPELEKATPTGATATPTDTNRRARLLNEMAYDGGRWKSGDVVAWYKTQGLTELGANTARRDLAALRDSGAITQHDEKGVRFYTRTTAKGGAQ